MSGMISILAGLLRTLFIRLPLGIWLAVLFSTGWVLLERHYQSDFPTFPCTLTWPPELVNPSFPDNPSRMTLLDPVKEQIVALKLGVGEGDLAFGREEYGALLGALFGALLCWPCGIWLTMRRYSGVLLFPIRVTILGLAYVAIGGGLGYWLAHLFGAKLISTGYVALFGLAMPIMVPLPFWILLPLFPSAARRQASVLLKQAKREAKTTLADIAKLDPQLGNVRKGKQQQEWDYYATVGGLFLGLLLGERRGATARERDKVEKLLRRQLNKQFEKGEPGLTAVSQFCKEYLEKGVKFTTEVLVGLWLAMQMKGGDLNAARDKDLAASLGGHMVQGMNRTWPARSKAGPVFSAILLWAGVGGLAFLAMNPAQVETQIAWLDGQINQRVAPVAQGSHTLADVKPDASAGDDSHESETSTSAETSAESSTVTVNKPVDENSPELLDGSRTAQAEGAPGDEEDKSTAEKASETDTLTKTEDGVVPAKETDTPPATAEDTPESTSTKLASTMREWSHASGRTLQATAVSYQNGAVELLREDGRSGLVALKDLSTADRQAIYAQFAQEAAAEDSPRWNPKELRIHHWSSADGAKQVPAAIISLMANAVELLRPDGRILVIPVEQLSPADQNYVQALLRSRI